MKGKNIITINGRLYDALTGMPMPQTQASQVAKSTTKPQAPRPQRVFSDVAKPVKKPAQATTAKPKLPRTNLHTAATAIHQRPQRSQTLHRAALKRPVIAQAKPAKPIVQRSQSISKFGSLYNNTPAAEPATSAPVRPEPPQQQPTSVKQHPAVAKALHNINQAQAPAKPAAVQSSKELKEMLIKERMAQVDATEKAKEKKPRRSFFGGQRRLTTILTSTLVILLLGGYLTYINLPNISMRVAATRAGVTAANFPSYKPDGYSFQGPITYSPGEITINFKSNTNDQSYAVNQKTSNWDSQAVLDNYVSQQTDSYLTYQERGLTIYSFDNKAAWVNGGLLYTIEGNAKLSGEQVLRIATSM